MGAVRRTRAIKKTYDKKGIDMDIDKITSEQWIAMGGKIKKSPTKKVKPIKLWECDVQFWAYPVKVKARTVGEARKKIREKLQKTPMIKAWHKETSYIDTY